MRDDHDKFIDNHFQEVFQLILDEIDRILYLTPQEALNSELRRGGSIKLKESVNVAGNNELATTGRNGSGFSVQSITKSSNSLLKVRYNSVFSCH